MTENFTDARDSQGFIEKPEGDVHQHIGDENTTNTDGGDAAGRDIYKPTINIDKATIIFPTSDNPTLEEVPLQDTGSTHPHFRQGDEVVPKPITPKSLLLNPSLTLYGFHLRTSLPDRVVPEAPKLWERLVDLGHALQIPELQALGQKLISYRDNQYYPKAEDEQEIEQLTLLRDGEDGFDFSVLSQIEGQEPQELSGLLCPYRLHDTYAIDFTVFSEESLTLEQLGCLNPQYLLLPSHIQASLGQTLFLFGEPVEPSADYRELADACITQLLPESSRNLDLVSTSRLLGNPLFEYESAHKDPARRLHFLVLFDECQSLTDEQIDKIFPIFLRLFLLRHKILYVYEQSQWCNRQAKQLYSKLEEDWLYRSIRDFSRKMLDELWDMNSEYARYLRDMRDAQTTLDVNENNYIYELEKLQNLPESNLTFLGNFLGYVRDKLKKQIQTDLRYLEPGQRQLQELLAVLEKYYAN